MIDISLQNIKKSFGGTEILRGVSFDVQAGERVALLGANGAGKTTLLRILTGALEPDEGTVVLAAVSKNHRSWLTVRTVPLKCSKNSSSHWVLFRSRWLVGSSSSRMSVSSKSSRARFTRVFSPPERLSKACSRMAAARSRPLATRSRS